MQSMLHPPGMDSVKCDCWCDKRCLAAVIGAVWLSCIAVRVMSWDVFCAAHCMNCWPSWKHSLDCNIWLVWAPRPTASTGQGNNSDMRIALSAVCAQHLSVCYVLSCIWTGSAVLQLRITHSLHFSLRRPVQDQYTDIATKVVYQFAMTLGQICTEGVKYGQLRLVYWFIHHTQSSRDKGCNMCSYSFTIGITTVA